MKTNFLKAGLAGLVLSAATIFPSQSQELPVKYLDKLVVNNDSTYTTIAYRSEKDGVEDMRELVKTSKVEEAWIFLPNWNLWYEVGKTGKNYEESSGNYNLNLILDTDYISKLLKKNNNVVLYHFHPEFVPEEISNMISKQSIKIQTALSSFNDLKTGVHFGRESSKYHPEGKMKCGLTSESGIVNFYLTKKGIEKYKDWTALGINSIIIKPKFGWINHFKESDEDIFSRIKNIADSMSDENIVIEFKTHEEYFSEFNK